MDSAATKILIVDDNESIRGLLGVLFRSERYEVIGELSSGDNFIATVKRLHPDIVCLDQEMPGKDGLTLLQELKELDSKIAVLMITGTKDPEFQQQAVAAGIAGFLRKPFSQVQVLKEIKQVDHARKQLLNTPAPTEKPADDKQLNIVVADDSAIMRELLVTILKSMGLSVVSEALDGQEAIDMVAKHKADILCLDLDMPNVSGLEALEKIRDGNSKVKVVIVSGQADRDKVKRALELGANGFIIKPFEAHQVVQAIKKLLS